MPTEPANMHATALVCGDTGLLLRGPSGSGKSALTLHLIAARTATGHFAAMVADDRVLINICKGRLVASAPAPLHGIAELRGHGIIAVPTVAAAVLDLVVDLVEPAALERMPETNQTDIAGIRCGHIRVPARALVPAAQLITNAL